MKTFKMLITSGKNTSYETIQKGLSKEDAIKEKMNYFKKTPTYENHSILEVTEISEEEHRAYLESVEHKRKSFIRD